MEKVIQDFSLFGIDELDKAYKQFQFRYVDNNKLKQNHIPMRRKPYKKMIMRKKFTEEDGLFHSTHGGVLRTGKSVMENMLLKMRNDGYDELRSQYNKILFKELKKQLENAPASNNNAPELIEKEKMILRKLSDEEIEILYNKMDSIIKNEGINRRALGEYDEMYVVELLRVKEILHKECINRQLDVSKNQNMEYQLWVE